MVFCGNTANAAGRPLGTRHKCFKKGVGVGIGIGEDKGKKIGIKRGKHLGEVVGTQKGLKRGEKIGKQKLLLGHSLKSSEVDRLTKDQLRDIILRRKRRGISTTGAVSRLSKPQLKAGLLTDLRRTNKLKPS